MQKTTNIKALNAIARNIRESVIRSIAAADSGHTGGSLGLADIFTCLYFNVLNHNPQILDWQQRDRMVLSIGHVAPVLYASLAEAGYFPKKELMSLRQLDSRLQGHPGRDHGLPGLELSAGSLGQGLSVAVGMALAAKHKKQPWRTYCLLGDGELQEGSVWEAAMSAAHHQLNTLTAIVDRNTLQIDGRTSDVMEIEPLTDKWEAFGWQVIHCDGNDIESTLHAFGEAEQTTKKPVVIIAKTLMGKGVKEIENDYRWHGKPVADHQVEPFINSLNHGA